MDKPGMAIILGKGEDKPKDMHEEAEADISQEELDAAAQVKAAMSGGDDEDVAMALKNFISVCGGY